MTMIQQHLPCLGPHGWFRIAYTEWPGPAGAPTVICVHGLTRNGRDFDTLANVLSVTYRVICPDLPGRGRSDWVPPESYGYPLYLSTCAALFARLGVEAFDWVGTSMGGLIGMLNAGLQNTPIRRLVLNDIGPFVPKVGREHIAAFVGKDPSFASVEEIQAYLERVYAAFGPLSPGEWRHLAAHSHRRKPDGTLGLAYDPAIGIPFQGTLHDVDHWASWDKVTCPTLVLRGSESNLLRAKDAHEMTIRGPKARLVEFAGVGHAPALSAADQIGSIVSFLRDE